MLWSGEEKPRTCHHARRQYTGAGNRISRARGHDHRSDPVTWKPPGMSEPAGTLSAVTWVLEHMQSTPPYPCPLHRGTTRDLRETSDVPKLYQEASLSLVTSSEEGRLSMPRNRCPSITVNTVMANGEPGGWDAHAPGPDSQLSLLTSNSCLCRPWEAVVMVEVIGFLPPMWIKSLVPGFGPSPHPTLTLTQTTSSH